MLNTDLCHQLGIEHPILSVGMGMAAGPDLAAAVSNAGGCGVIGTSRVPPANIRERIAQVRAKTQKPFGVNVILAQLQEGKIIGTTVWADGTTVEVPRYTSFMVTPHFKGDLDYAPIWAGESCSHVKDIKPAAQIVREIVLEAEQVIAALSLQTHAHHNSL